MAKKSTYQGKLTPAEAVEGMAAAMRNCRRLAADAAILLAAGSWPTAASLAILAVEEAGKVHVLRTLLTTTDPAALKKGWENYHGRHRHKVGRPLGLSTVHGPLTDLTSLRAAMGAQGNLAEQFDQLKQSGLYSDCLQDSIGCPQWKEPVSSISEEHAGRLVRAAEEQASTPAVKLRELELLVKHFRPIAGTTTMAFARSAWLAEMAAEGLLNKSVVEIQVEHADMMLGNKWRTGTPEFEAKLAAIIQFARDQFARKRADQNSELTTNFES